MIKFLIDYDIFKINGHVVETEVCTDARGNNISVYTKGGIYYTKKYVFHQNFFDKWGNVYSVMIPSMELQDRTVELKTIYANYARLYSSLKGLRPEKPKSSKILVAVKDYKTKEQYEKLCIDRKKEMEYKERLDRINMLNERFAEQFAKYNDLLIKNMIAYVFDKMEKNNDFIQFYEYIVNNLIDNFTKKYTFAMMATQFVENRKMYYITLPDGKSDPAISMVHIEQQLKSDFDLVTNRKVYDKWLYKYAHNYAIGLKDPKYIHFSSL